MQTVSLRRRVRPCRPCQQNHQPVDLEIAEFLCLVQRTAAYVTRQLNDPTVDRDDVCQELWIRLARGMANFDSNQGDRFQYAAMLLKRQRASLLRARYAAKRTSSTVSLQQPVPVDDDGWTDLAATISYQHQAARLGRDPAEDCESSDLRQDVQSVVETLSPDEQALAHRLMNGSIADAARESGTPRTTLNDQVRRLRRPFEQARMKAYLE